MSSKTPALNLEQINLADLRKLADFLNETVMEEVEIELGEARVRLKRPSPHTPQAPTTPTYITANLPSQSTSTAATKPQENKEGNVFESPMVGTFYRASGPDSAPFVKEGDEVKAGQTLCIIEAMKTMNQIEADRSGKIMKILVENAKPVEFGQPLFVIA